jgi:DNA mismatch repair protein MutS
MEQFFRAKDRYPDAILFFRLGDFYEMFYEDAVIASQLLDLTLTSRSKTSEGEPIPMAGVPHHAAPGYIARLLEKGQKVAVCEQMADPSKVKGVVPREVVRVVSPGLTVDSDALDARTDNWLVAVTESRGVGPIETGRRVSMGPTTGDGTTPRDSSSGIGVAALELSTGELRACELPDATALLAEVVRLDPRELLLPAGSPLAETIARVLPRCAIRELDGATADPAALAAALGEAEAKRAHAEVPAIACAAAAGAIAYAQAAQPQVKLSIPRLALYDPAAHLILDEAAVRNLEVVRTLRGEREGSLLHLVDQTKTSMGARMLRRRLLAPLSEVPAVRRRHDAVEALVLDAGLRADLRDALGAIGDLERLATRAALGVATPRDLGAIRDGLRSARAVADRLRDDRVGSLGLDHPIAATLDADLCDDVVEMLATALVDDPPPVHTQGGIVRERIDPSVDELRALSASSKDFILALEERERQRTGISSLKIRFTKVFGYYIEITKSNLKHGVPDEYRRKQTVANGERFSTTELDELQAKILNADERLRALEQQIFEDLRRRVAAAVSRLRALAGKLADLDVHCALAEIAHRFGYVRPEIDGSVQIELRDARHPIVERLAAAGSFVPNDVVLDAGAQRLMVITGPNMAGKSTAMRQVALAVILAQAGGFVPASRARIGVVDRVYTRVGASDDLGRGQSTFMVEMREAASILRAATRRSLVILDEIGRGTSTYDGVSIAWAVAEHLHDAIGCRAMFATHYHELCELAATRPGVVNFNVTAREHGDEVIFLHRLLPGAANRSYGIAVARLAGVPEIVLARAKSILVSLERDGRGRGGQLDLFGTKPAPEPPAPSESEVESTLRALDLERMTPIEALIALDRLKKMTD